MQYINDDILYFEGEHIINIGKEVDVSSRIYSKRAIKSSNIEDFNANYFWYGNQQVENQHHIQQEFSFLEVHAIVCHFQQL